MPRNAPRKTPTWMKLLLALFTVALCCGGLEALLRCGGYGCSEQAFEFEGDVGGFIHGEGLFVPHPQRFYTLGANYRALPHHLGMYATGSWPFRGAPPEPKPEGLPRVAVVGDSNVFGVGVNVADALPAQIQLALEAELGLDPTQVQVAGFGVPAYSTVQIRHLLEHEVLARGKPFACVLYLAAWNDHAPALGRNDLELREHVAASPAWQAFRRSATCEWLLSWVGTPTPSAALTRNEILHGWSQGAPPLGRRVPEPALEREVEAILDLATNACEHVVLVLGAHRTRPQRDFPGLARDRETVRRAAARRRLACVDAHSLFSAAPPPFDAYLCDSVHPSPRGARLLARGVANALRGARDARAWPHCDGSWRVRSVAPARASALGDARIRVELDAWRHGEPAPWFDVGFAPLLDVVEIAPGIFEGTALANAPGPHDLIVSARSGVARAKAAIELEPPHFEVAREVEDARAPWIVRFHSRPGDAAKVRVGRRRAAVPDGKYAGSEDELDPEESFELPWQFTADEGGTAQIEVPAAVMCALPGKYFLRGLVIPRGTDSRESCWRYTPLLEIEVPRA